MIEIEADDEVGVTLLDMYADREICAVRRACREAMRASDEEMPFVFLQTLRDSGLDVIPITTKGLVP